MYKCLYILLFGYTIIVGLSACGGSSGQLPDQLLINSQPILPQATSYLNFKNVGLQPQALPANVAGNGATARSYGDFFKRGHLDLFAALLTYDIKKPAASASPARFSFWIRQEDGNFVEDSTRIVSDASNPATLPCIHPRKAIVADFNKDAIPDIFVVCHGYDGGGFPGETNKLLLSRADGKFILGNASPDVAFWHGATALDVNGDGAVDVIAADGGNRISTFLNNGAGRLTREENERFPLLGQGGYYTIEVVDINGDGHLDILTGGHESSVSPTLAILNPGTSQFHNASPIVLPAVSGFGVVLDFVITNPGPNASIWALRTGSGNNFYVGKMIQKIDWASRTGSIVLQTGGTWVPWIIPTKLDGKRFIASDAISHAFMIAY